MRIPHDYFANLVVNLSHGMRASVARVSKNFHVSQTSHEGFKHVKNFYVIFFSPKYVARLSRDSRKTFVRVSRSCHYEILANLNNVKIYT